MLNDNVNDVAGICMCVTKEVDNDDGDEQVK